MLLHPQGYNGTASQHAILSKDKRRWVGKMAYKSPLGSTTIGAASTVIIFGEVEQNYVDGAVLTRKKMESSYGI